MSLYLNPDPTTTRFLSAEQVAAIVHARGLAECVAGVAANIAEDFRRWDAFEKCARVASHSHDGVIELMPVTDGMTYAFKYVNGHPKNPRYGLPTVMAFGVLADVATGMPGLVSELTLTTAIRTAATSAVAARVLARADARTMAIIGNGAQSEFQAVAFHHLLGIERFHRYDVDARATDKQDWSMSRARSSDVDARATDKLAANAALSARHGARAGAGRDHRARSGARGPAQPVRFARRRGAGRAPAREARRDGARGLGTLRRTGAAVLARHGGSAIV